MVEEIKYLKDNQMEGGKDQGNNKIKQNKDPKS